MTDKKLRLALNFKDAPKEVQEAVDLYVTLEIELENADIQINLWNKEKQKVRDQYSKAKKQLLKELDAWDPDNKKEKKVLDGTK